MDGGMPALKAGVRKWQDSGQLSLAAARATGRRRYCIMNGASSFLAFFGLSTLSALTQKPPPLATM